MHIILNNNNTANVSKLIINTIICLWLGRFDHSGLAEGDIDWQNVGPVERLRVNIHSGCVNWIVMTELSLEIVYIENEMTLPSPVEVNEEEYESW